MPTHCDGTDKLGILYLIKFENAQLNLLQQPSALVPHPDQVPKAFGLREERIHQEADYGREERHLSVMNQYIRKSRTK
jgi:hypothetical protein